MVKQQYVMEFTTRTDYYQTFEISFDEFWEDYCKECEFDEEESGISTWNQEDLRDVAWDIFSKTQKHIDQETQIMTMRKS